jgi:hypothetical protein
VDAACQRHDNCYDAAVADSGGSKYAENQAKCACDSTLMAEANGIKAGATFLALPDVARTTVEGILKVFTVKCPAIALWTAMKDAVAASRAASASAEQGA